MVKTLTHRLDDACREHGLEWVALPFEPSPAAWRAGPYWGALLRAERPKRGGRHSRFFAYYAPQARIWNDPLPEPDVVYIMCQPSGRHEIKRLLLAQIPCG
jgi:hypothetical protein